MVSNNPAILSRLPCFLDELVKQLGGELDPSLDRSLVISTIGASHQPVAVDLAPILHERGAHTIRAHANVFLVQRSIAERVPKGLRWVHPQAEWALAKLLYVDEPAPFQRLNSEVSSTTIDPSTQISAGVHIAHHVTIGSHCVIEPNVVIYPNVTIGNFVHVGAGSILGRPGFGFVSPEQTPNPIPMRIPHRAGVIIHDYVEIGPLCTIDAGILLPTQIGACTLLDAHIHIGHGVQVGQHCRIAAQVGLAGSVVVEDYVWIGGQAGVADHVHIGQGARIAAKSGVIGDVPAKAIFAGYPAVARSRWLRGFAKLYRS